MGYEDIYSEEITRKLSRLLKKDITQYNRVQKKIDSIIKNPKHSYKFLHHDMKGFSRVHVGHYVIVFCIDHKNRSISFEDYDHHDKIYN